MNPVGIDHQAERRLALPSRVDRPEKGVLKTHKWYVAGRGHRFAARGIGRTPPDDDAILGPGKAKARRVARRAQDCTQAGLTEEAEVVKEKPPGQGLGGCVLYRRNHQLPVALLTVLAVPIVPVSTPSVFCH